MSKKWSILVLLLLGTFLAMPSSASAAKIGDRLVVSLNNQPYSQRQIEVYFSIKELLRNQVDETLLMVDENNWRRFLNVYIEDMIILQEAVRLGSFQVNDVALQKYFKIVKSQFEANKKLQANFARLGIDSSSLKSTLSNVLRVAGFRRSKSRLVTSSAKDEDYGTTEDSAARFKKRWLNELKERAVIRTYENAYNYVFIDPSQGISK